MRINEIMRILQHAPRADKSAIIGINLRAERRSLAFVGTRFIASHGVGRRDNVTPSTCPPDRLPRPVGRDKSGPYAILAPLVQLRLMRIRADKSAMGTINRPLQMAG